MFIHVQCFGPSHIPPYCSVTSSLSQSSPPTTPNLHYCCTHYTLKYHQPRPQTTENKGQTGHVCKVQNVDDTRYRQVNHITLVQRWDAYMTMFVNKIDTKFTLNVSNRQAILFSSKLSILIQVHVFYMELTFEIRLV